MPPVAENDNSQPLPAKEFPPVGTADPALLVRLGNMIAKIENSSAQARLAPPEPILPHTAGDLLGLGWMHEFWAEKPQCHGAAMGFLLDALKNSHREILWVLSPTIRREHGLPYGPGLLDHGIDPARLILVCAATEQDALWAMDEGLKAGTLAAVVGETPGMPLNASRRLALTAKEEGIPCLHLVRSEAPAPSATHTRWQVYPVPSKCAEYHLPGPARLSIRPVKHRSGHPPNRQTMEWQDETHHFHLATSMADRPMAQETPRRHRNTG